MKSCILKILDLSLDVVTEDATGKSVPQRVENIAFRIGAVWICLDGWKKNGQTLAEYLTANHLGSLHEAA